MDPTQPDDDTRRRFLQLVAATTAGVGTSSVALGQGDGDGQTGTETPTPQEDDIPVAGDFPDGQTVGLQKVAEGLPAPTGLAYYEGDEQRRHFIVTQTGQIYAYTPQDGADGETQETPTDGQTPEDDQTPQDGEAGTSAGNGATADEFVLEGISSGWVGVEPEDIAEEENPPLRMRAGETYTITWENVDGAPHNIVLLDGAGDIIERTEIIEEQGATQSIEFEATEEMDEYVCEVHQGTMSGRIVVSPTPEDEVEETTDVATTDDMDLFLDIENRVISLGIGRLGNYDERGLLDVAFHPDFQENRKFYVHYSAPERGGRGFDHTGVISEFEANEDLTSADPDSERTIMEVPQPQDNHNGGQLSFGPDGYLHVSLGDGGNVHDIGLGHVEDWYGENEGGNGQDTEQNLLGGILRIDVDPGSDEEAAGPGDGAYDIPDDNPLVDEDGHLGEYYAWGFRNPWGMSIDEEGTMFVTDAGQHRIESAYQVEAGGNYSWNVKEGSSCFDPANPLQPPDDCPDQTPEDVRGGEPLLDPIAEFRHLRTTEAFIDSSVVTGGHRYEGDAIPDLQGNFVFGNWSSEGVARADGEVLVAVDPGGQESDGDDGGGNTQQWDLEELVFEGADDGSLNRYVYGIERDQDGELYVRANTDFRPFPESGEIYRIVPAGEGEAVPAPEDVATVDQEMGDDGGEEGMDGQNETAPNDQDEAPADDGNESATPEEQNETVPGDENETAPSGENETVPDDQNATATDNQNVTATDNQNVTATDDQNATAPGGQNGSTTATSENESAATDE